jgi:hypothetical protein
LTATATTRLIVAVWAERALTSVWRSVSAAHYQTEACLEAALVSALEAPEVLQRLATHLGWCIPSEPPTITTQDKLHDGRSDVTLTWKGQDAKRLILELKVDGPPERRQIKKYLSRHADVAAIARFWRPTQIAARGPGKFLGVFTWRQIRELPWDDSLRPLPLRQLFHLLDATGVIMPNITLAGLTGLVSSWTVRDRIRDWARQAAEPIASEFAVAGLDWVFREGAKGPVKIDKRSGRYAVALRPSQARSDSLFVFAGMFVGCDEGHDGERVLVEGVPDLFFALHVDPGKEMGEQLANDSALKEAAKRWQKREGNVQREYFPGQWEVLRARESAFELLKATKQDEMFHGWLCNRAHEWVEDGVLQRVAEIGRATRDSVG